MPATKPRAYQVYDIDWKQAVRALSDSNINLASPGALVIDAVVLDPYDRVLLTAQTNATENGIYQVNAAQTLLVPAPDWVNINSGLSSAVNSGLTVTVTEGADYAQTTWTLTTPNPIVIGVTAIVFEQVPEASDRIGNIYFDGSIIELANSVPETDISILPSGAGSDVGIVIPNDATANVDDLHIFNLATNGNVKISTDGGDWRYDTAGNFTGNGNVQAGYFLGNGALLTGISAGSSYSNANVANYLPTFSGNISAGNVSATGNISGNYFIGNGSQLTGINASSNKIFNGNSYANIATANGNLDINVGNDGYGTWTFVAGTGNLVGPGNASQGAGIVFSADQSVYVREDMGQLNIDAGSDIVITTNSGNVGNTESWTFGANGNLTVPGNIIGSGNILIAPDSASSSSYLDIYLTGGPDIHIASNDNSIVIGRDTGANVFVGNDGEVSIRTDNGVTAQVWNFTDTGNLTLPGNTFSVNYANGDPVTFTANTGNVTFSGEAVIGTGTSNTQSGLYLAPDPVSLANNLYLRVRGNILDEPTHIHFDTGNNQYYNQFIGDDNKYIQLANTGNIVINTNNYAGNTAQWNFDTDGTLTLPAGSSRITSYGQITIECFGHVSQRRRR